MSWFRWFLIVLWVLALIQQVSRVGKPREPITNTDAALSVFIVAVLIFGVVTSW